MLLAIYGTLRKGEELSYYLDHLRKVGETETVEISGLRLFVVGMAPGAEVTNDPNDKAIVELIDVDVDKWSENDILGVLDTIEGVRDGLYERGYIDTPRGRALVYTKCGEVGNCVRITDWKEWQKESAEEKARALLRAGDQAIWV